MTTVIEARGVSKKFLLRHNASVELKVRFLGLLSPRHRQSVEEFWALKNVSFQHRSRRGGRVDRPQRIGQEHVFEADRRDPSANQRTPARLPGTPGSRP